MVAIARRLLHGAAPEALGVSFGGPVRASAGVVLQSHHVPGWENVPLRARLASEFGARVVIDNDANVAALGEARFGAGKNCASVLYLTVSTGVGGGWVLDGKIYRGASELAGEIGHMVIDPAGPPCPCGRRGCVEQLASGTAIARRAQALLRARPPDVTDRSLLLELAHDDVTAITGQLVSQAAQQGDSLARQALEDAARALGFAIGNVIVLMNPARIIIGGGVSKAGDAYLEMVRRAARANVMPELRQAVHIVPAALGDDAPLWGACALAEGTP
jgi:glucokinase